MSKATVVWQKIFNRHVGALKSNEEMPAGELKSRLKSMIELIGLRWAMYTPPLPREADKSLRDLLDVCSDFPARRTPPARPREGGEEVPWWDRKTRYDFFDSHAKAIILRAADKNRFREHLDAKSSDSSLLKAVAKMAGKKVAWKKLPNVGVEKGFAASVLFVLDGAADLEVVDKQEGGLSVLLAMLEKALKLI